MDDILSCSIQPKELLSRLQRLKAAKTPRLLNSLDMRRSNMFALLAENLDDIKKRGGIYLPVCRLSFLPLCSEVNGICLKGHGMRITVAERAACAPMTSTCAMSAVFDGPLMKVP